MQEKLENIYYTIWFVHYVPSPIFEHLSPVFPMFLYLIPGKIVFPSDCAIFVPAGSGLTKAGADAR